jgi:hypothetical protein
MSRFVLTLAFIVAGLSAYAQSAQFVDAILDEKPAKYADAAFLVLASAGKIAVDAQPAKALEFLASSGWGIEVKNAGDPVNLGDFSYLIMKAHDLTGGIMYTILPGPRYAVKELAYEKIVSGNIEPDRNISGEEAVRILSKAIDFKASKGGVK